jgi:hypothetical protein
VSVPLSESQRYDLIVDDESSPPQRVEVKTTDRIRSNGSYQVELRTSGGNRSGIGKTTLFDPLFVDLLYVVAGDGWEYCIPTSALDSVQSLTLGTRMQRWRVPHAGASW